ncbi:sugar ABC transporter ATP-binding protein [Ornithinimicrobium faecis]|uniref:Autoinducer 2 import ATP-binding protein LsrA n=1 Tax=Ornithinimicrobium faecis TaxID=2934158 RepID=A0ABY4YQY1_9MICO|nr:sugar ABC transporter ATP-binding protein [Ornithinimicrobium sp. HY1793]USQ79166.1 sugar ABC transporter ATP-binding protein [Ornithinimicrobium sp. HY1793]
MEHDASQPPANGVVAAVERLWKSYGGIPVLKGVDIDVQAGEIHALVGGNGAGKSTLMKALTGVVTPDAGRIVIGGSEVRNLNPRTAHANAVYMVPQEPQLFPNLTVFENVTLSLAVPLSRAEVKAAIQALGHAIDLDARAHELSISDQQLIEIVRGVLRKARLLIVDEPTGALTAREADQLFERLRALAASGVGIFYVTHRMSEIFALCDRVTVLRDGAMVLQKATADTSVEELVSTMVPESEQVSREEQGQVARAVDGPPALSLQGFTGQGFTDVTLDVFPGEVLGIAGVVGAGRTELAETVFGLRPGTGDVTLLGERYQHRSPKRSLTRGLSYVAEDRHAHGVFLLGTITENCSSTVLSRVTSLGLLNSKRERQVASRLTTQLAVQKGSAERRVGNLSGGNQQKVSLAKSLAPEPRVIILDEPSRGVDVGARADLYKMIRELAEQGLAVLLISSDFEEIVELATRVVIMRDGRIGEELEAEQITFSAIRDGAFGTRADGVSV